MKSSTTALKVGVTGGIGSGKTTVCKLIEKMGFPVFYADVEAKNLMRFNKNIVNGVIRLFGEAAYQGNELNRAHLAQIVFNNPSLLNELNKIIHPEVRLAFDNFALKNEHRKLVFNEAAILFETGAYKNFDATILVTASSENRILRVGDRDQMPREKILERMDNQWSDEKKIPLASYVILNDHEALQPQIETILNDLLTKIRD
jgi:dephospho-CoA kinase